VTDGITWVGLDVHKKSVNVAMLLPGEKTSVEWELENTDRALRRLKRRLVEAAPGEIRCCYEAGPCGYVIQRQLMKDNKARIICEVVAPALIPVKPGDRIKTDRRDARKLAGLLRAGLLTEVCPPTEDEEAVRDLVRCREDATEDLLRARHRLGKYLLRRGLVHGPKQKAWTARHRLWLRGLRLERPADQAVFDDYLLAIENLESRLETLEARLKTIAEQAPYAEPLGWLRCFRGIDTITAMTILAEIHDFRRFQTPRGFMAYLGLTPSENSSGGSRRLGSITRMGNRHVRRIMVQSAWQYRHRPGVSRKLKQRREGQPAHVIALAEKAQQRLCRRFRTMTERGKPVNKSVVAIARELAGFIWVALHNYNMRTV